MPGGKKTPDSKKEEIKAIMMINPDASCRDIAKVVDLPFRTVNDIQREVSGTDDFTRYRTKKKEEFIDNAWRVVEKALTLVEKRFDKALADEEAISELIKAIYDNEDLTQTQKKAMAVKLNALQMTNIKDIAIALGTIYDKQALASGDPTNINRHEDVTDNDLKDKLSTLINDNPSLKSKLKKAE